MATFVAENSGDVKKKPMIILKELFFFVLVSTSGASDWQASACVKQQNLPVTDEITG